MNKSVPVKDNTEDVVLNSHVGIASRNLMRPVRCGTTGQHDEGSARLREDMLFISGLPRIWLFAHYASGTNVCENASEEVIG